MEAQAHEFHLRRQVLQLFIKMREEFDFFAADLGSILQDSETPILKCFGELVTSPGLQPYLMYESLKILHKDHLQLLLKFLHSSPNSL